MKIGRIHKIGFVITLAIALLIWGINFLRNEKLFRPEDLYYAVYERIDGLTVSSPVMVNGYKVGQVRSIEFMPGTSGRLVVGIGIENKYKIPQQATAFIYSADLMGSKAVKLIYGQENSFHQSGDTLSSKIERELFDEVSAQVLPVKQKAEDLMLSVDSVLVVIRSIFDKNTRKNLAESFASIKTTLHNLERSSYALDGILQQEKHRLASIIGNVDSISSMLKNNSKQFDLIISNFEAVSDSLAQSEIKNTIAHTNATLSNLNEILAQINQGQGSLGQLVHNDTLYRNLENSTYNLNRLLRDLRENPKRYLHFSVFDVGKNVYQIDPEEKKQRERRKKIQDKDKGRK